MIVIVANSYANTDLTQVTDIASQFIVNVPTKNRFSALETDDDIIQTPNKKHNNRNKSNLQ